MNSPFPLYDAFPEAVMVIDPIADRVEYGNKNLLKLLNCGAQDLSMVHVSRLFKTSLAQLITFTREVEQHGEGMTQALSIHINNVELGLEATGSLLHEGDRRLLCLVLRDRRKMQIWRMKNSTHKNQQLGLLQWPRIHEVFQQIEKENQLILSAAGEGIYGVDADGNTTFVNPAAERMLGFKAEELIGHNVHAAIHHSHSDGSDYCAHDCPIYAAFKDGQCTKWIMKFFGPKMASPCPLNTPAPPFWIMAAWWARW